MAIKEPSEQSAGVGGVGAAQLKMSRGSTGGQNKGEDACVNIHFPGGRVFSAPVERSASGQPACLVLFISF